MFQKAYDRLTGVLGRDCQGRVLRRGDRVELGVPPEDVDELAACPGVVVGPYEGDPDRIAVKNANGIAHARPHCWRKLDEGDDADWRQVADATGWTPHSVPQRDEVVA